MDHNYLHALMHGELSSKKKPAKSNAHESKLEKDLDKEIDAYVDNYVFEENPDQKALQDLKVKREKLRTEIKEAVKLPEFSAIVEKAIDILSNEGSNQLSKGANQLLHSELSAASIILAKTELKGMGGSTLQSITKISNETMNLVAELALAKFAQELFGDSEALFSLLSILNPGYSEYWLRLGISAQKNENLDLASRAYAAACLLDPDNIGARLFGAECLIQRSLLDESKAELEAAKNIASKTEIDPMWLELIVEIEGILKAKHVL